MSASVSAWDYIVVVAMLTISLLIGVLFAYRARHKNNIEELLLAGRSMGVFPVSMSLLASFISAIMILGSTAEVYMFGIVYYLMPFCQIVVIPFVSFLVIPVFYNLRISSAYEYLEMRFKSTLLRKACSATCTLQMLMYMAVVLYAPSLAINAIMGFNVWLSVIVCGVVCTLYTSLGGLKAVMWTDVFQVLMMSAGLLAIICHGFSTAGGDAIWKTAVNTGRVNFTEIFAFTPFKRYDFYSVFIGSIFVWAPIYAVNQAQVQRAVACPTLRTAQAAFMVNIPGMVILQGMGLTCGIVVLNRYVNCDPLMTGTVKSADQLLPLYVMDELSRYPGIPGLFMAAVFSGSLSTISSGINSLTTVTLEDFIVPYFPKLAANPQRMQLSAKIISVLFGVIIMLLTVVASVMGSVSKAALSLFGMVGGPLFGIFCLGMFFPPANAKGAIGGLLIGLASQFWIGFGAIAHGVAPVLLPRTTDQCPVNATEETLYDTTTTLLSLLLSGEHDKDATAETIAQSQPDDVMILYKMSYLWYGLVALVVTTVSGLIISFLTGRTKSSEINPLTLSPITRYICGYNHNKVDVDVSLMDKQLEPLSEKQQI